MDGFDNKGNIKLNVVKRNPKRKRTNYKWGVKQIFRKKSNDPASVEKLNRDKKKHRYRNKRKSTVLDTLYERSKNDLNNNFAPVTPRRMGTSPKNPKNYQKYYPNSFNRA